jgi:hypothetical protein
MNKKFLFSANGAIQTFYKKNDFIEHCQKMFNQIGESKKKEEFLFSYDGGQNWYSINDFKLLRQTIQNEKYTAPDKQQVNLNSNKRTPIKSDKFYNEVKQILFALVFFGGLVYIIKGTNFLNTIKEEFENFNTESNFSLKSDEEQNSIDPLSSGEETEGFNGMNPCSKCSGDGGTYISCSQTTMHCRNCNGTRFDDYGRTCLNCNGSGIVTCSDCNGSGIKWKNCFLCRGKKYTHFITCTKCNGEGCVLPPEPDENDKSARLRWGLDNVAFVYECQNGKCEVPVGQEHDNLPKAIFDDATK